MQQFAAQARGEGPELLAAIGAESLAVPFDLRLLAEREVPLQQLDGRGHLQRVVPPDEALELIFDGLEK